MPSLGVLQSCSEDDAFDSDGFGNLVAASYVGNPILLPLSFISYQEIISCLSYLICLHSSEDYENDIYS